MRIGISIRAICLFHLALQVLKYNFFSWGLRPTFSVASGTLSLLPDGETQGKMRKKSHAGWRQEFKLDLVMPLQKGC